MIKISSSICRLSLLGLVSWNGSKYKDYFCIYSGVTILVVLMVILKDPRSAAS